MNKTIFEMIADSDKPISGDVIGQSIGMSRVAVNKHIKRLLERGINIQATPKGYRYFPSDTLDEMTLNYKLRKAGVDCLAVVLACDSTNTYAKTLDIKGDYIVVAPYQFVGKGRLERQFESKEGGVYMTIARKFQGLLIQDSLNMVLLTGVAVSRVLKDYGIKSAIKWPNDVFVGDKKICGILLESTSHECSIERIYQGIGINVNNSLGEDLHKIATTMSENCNSQVICREDIIVKVAQELQQLVKGYIQHGQAEFLKEYTDLSRTIGHVVTVNHRGQSITGKAIGLSPLGYLKIEYQGAPLEIVAGDIM